MDWLSGNWIWVVLIVGMLGMHLFAHGGHGGGGCCGGHRGPKEGKRPPDAAK